MIFHPANLIQTEGSFALPKNANAIAHPCLNKDIIREFWYNFSFQSSTLTLSECDEFVFQIGSTQKLPIEQYEYSLHIDADGICLCANSEASLLQGYMTLLDRFRPIDREDQTAVEADCCQLLDKACIQNRMVHFCIFPETELWELQRFVRFCGALKYTHIILEFWGMLQYDCLKELAWPHAFTKDQIRPIIREANDLGMEVIPMFNHLGHASAGRVMHGKHVVLDQNPALQSYFTEDGWCWDIRKPKVRTLLRLVRNELIELCGKGSYFHIGCDETYNFPFTKENMDLICELINELCKELRGQNRRAIAWGDMFLFRHPHYNPANKYTCNAPTSDIEQYMLEHLNRDVILADWQYDAPKFPVETASVFAKAGFETFLCPWDRGAPHIHAALATVKEQALSGVIHTTWHTLSKGMPYVTFVAIECFEDQSIPQKTPVRTQTAALLRKVMPCGGIYERSGWSKWQVDFSW